MATNQWNDSDPSDDDANQDSLATRKRSSRACDQCRKTKSKCEPSPSSPSICKSCVLAGTACTFLGPSYKRGPPKGYIQAIEQRWHQVESLLGAVLASPDGRVQDILNELRQDELAREILNRVDAGPFGPTGRLANPAGATKEDFFASIFRSNEASSRDSARSRRQSRISREMVSSSRDNTLSTMPTPEWQDNLSTRLLGSDRRSQTTLPSRLRSQGFNGEVPLSQRRRYEDSSSTGQPAIPDWSDMYTMDPLSESPGDDGADPSDMVGQLSLDENQEVRFHGKASGLHLLGRSDRMDGRHDGGIWRLPMMRFWPSNKSRQPRPEQPTPPDVASSITLPPSEAQDHLIGLYFAFVHPIFPVIHKRQFLREYNRIKLSSHPSTPEAFRESPSSLRGESSQAVTKLLLLSIFAMADRYSTENGSGLSEKPWESDRNYHIAARELIAAICHSSRTSTCQALLLLGLREFASGSLEQGWLYLGMAMRMAEDLGLNRASDGWQLNGINIFTPEENQARKQIWWGCCVADKYGSVYMGRPVCIRESDFDTLLPEVDEGDDSIEHEHQADIGWRSPPTSIIMSCFRASASLSVIVGTIVDLVYPVRFTARTPRQHVLKSLESRLDHWYMSVSDNLRYDPSSKRNMPPWPVLYLHIHYWWSVLLLHRAFLPNWRSSDGVFRNPSVGSDTGSLKAFDLCQRAATYISTIVTTCHENFDLKNGPPFLTPHILAAGIMHIVTLTLRPSNVQAYIGLQQALAGLRNVQNTWPSAARAWDLLHGAKVHFDGNLSNFTPGTERPKRPADDAFGNEKSSDFLQREAFGDSDRKPPAHEGANGIQDISTRMMAHMLGLDIPGIEPSTSYYPGYEWWPRNNMVSNQPFVNPAPSAPVNQMSQGSVADFQPPSSHEWSLDTDYPYTYTGVL